MMAMIILRAGLHHLMRVVFLDSRNTLLKATVNAIES